MVPRLMSPHRMWNYGQYRLGDRSNPGSSISYPNVSATLGIKGQAGHGNSGYHHGRFDHNEAKLVWRTLYPLVRSSQKRLQAGLERYVMSGYIEMIS